MSTRRVEDKKQMPEFDFRAWAEENDEVWDDDDLPSNPCPVCNSTDHEEVLLLCDGCDACYHTYCIGLDSIPAGSWFCMECEHALGPDLSQSRDGAEGNRPGLRRLYYFPRTQASMRRARQRARSDDWQGAWGRITGHIWEALELDLDYHDEDPEVFEGLRRSRQLREQERREHERWLQRLNIASRLGAREVFRSNLPQFARPEPPQPQDTQESRKEQLAWSALEKARECESRKRSRSASAEPQEEHHHEPERKLKRPRTRRLPPHNHTNGESSTAGKNLAGSSHRADAAPSDAQPSFLSALLKEVEMSTPSDEETLVNMFGPIPGAHSPARSPSIGTITPPRASSPQMTLSSHIGPNYPPAHYSPTRASSSASSRQQLPSPNRKLQPSRGRPSSPENSDSESRGCALRQAAQKSALQLVQSTVHHRPLELRQPQPRRAQNVTLSRSENTSPTRSNLPLEMKQSISEIVRTALKPHWHSRKLTAEQYETINRDVSRRIYEQVKDPSAVNEEMKQRWQITATQEVARAVASLKA